MTHADPTSDNCQTSTAKPQLANPFFVLLATAYQLTRRALVTTTLVEGRHVLLHVMPFPYVQLLGWLVRSNGNCQGER